LNSKKIIVSSFHSGSVYAIHDKNYDFDCMVSFDSHVDTRIAGYRQEVVDEISSNFPLQQTASRAAAHVMFRNTFKNLNELLLVIPKVCFESDVAWVNHDIQKRMPDSDFGGIDLEKEKEALKIAWRIDVLYSPPKDPLSEVRKFVHGKKPLFDIDVDYFGDMQGECYTPMKGAKRYDLGNLERTIKLIKKVKPEIITISEATVAALDDSNSKTNHLLDKLADIGYERDDFFIFDDDDEAKYYLGKFDDFNRFYQENSSFGFLETGETASKESSEELRQMVRDFFKDDLYD